jgi:predicted aconitase
LKLNDLERAMLAGDLGPAIQEAIAFQIRIGDFYGAEDFVEITNAHMMGDIEVMGDSGLSYLKCVRKQNARCRVPVTTNARCIDFQYAESLGQEALEVEKERELIRQLRGMNVITTDTCINYQTVYQPHLGEHVAWGDTGTVIFANSILGARTNFESGPAALAAGLTGRTPRYGFHLDEHRRGSFRVNVTAKLEDLADWGALGRIIGLHRQHYFAVPVIDGLPKATPDELKHLGAALASYGSMALFHIPGQTPEADDLGQLFDGTIPDYAIEVGDADLNGVYRSYDVTDPQARLVVFSGPQLSLFELKYLAERFEGRRVATGTRVFVTSGSGPLADATRLGYLQTLQGAGVMVLEGVCFYILQNLTEMRQRHGWHNLVSNSAKLVNIIGAHRFNTILRRTDACIEAALTGRVESFGESE